MVGYDIVLLTVKAESVCRAGFTVQLGRDCGWLRHRSVDCEGCECLSCWFHNAAEEIVVGYDIVPWIVKAESVCRAGFTMQLKRLWLVTTSFH